MSSAESAARKALLRYDPANKIWTALAELNQSREHTAAVALGGKIYAVAGRWSGVGELTSVEVYDSQTDAWTYAPSMNVARGGLGAAVLDDRIFAVGGEVFAGGTATLESVEVYDPAQATWTLAGEATHAAARRSGGRAGRPAVRIGWFGSSRGGRKSRADADISALEHRLRIPHHEGHEGHEG